MNDEFIENQKIAQDFLGAIRNGDVDAISSLLHQDCVVWHSTDGICMTHSEVVKWAGIFQSSAIINELLLGRYDDLPNGFLQKYHFSGQIVDGPTLDFDGLLVAEISHGQIIKLDEWLDHGAMAAFAAG